MTEGVLSYSDVRWLVFRVAAVPVFDLGETWTTRCALSKHTTVLSWLCPSSLARMPDGRSSDPLVRMKSMSGLRAF